LAKVEETYINTERLISENELSPILPIVAQLGEVIGNAYIIRHVDESNTRTLANVGDPIYLHDQLITSSGSSVLAYHSASEHIVMLNPLSKTNFSPVFVNQVGNGYSSNDSNRSSRVEDDNNESMTLLEKLLAEQENIESILPLPSADNSTGDVQLAQASRLGLVVIWARTGNEITPVKGYKSDINAEDTDFFNNQIDNGTLFDPESFFQTPTTIASPDVLIISEDSISNGGNVASNDTSNTGDVLQYSVVSGKSVASGSLVFNSNGSYTYTPNTNFSGSDSFTYQVSDADGNTSTATVSITILPAVDLSAVSQTETSNEDVIFTSTVSQGNNTTSGGTLTYTLISGPTNGVLTSPIEVNTGNYGYTPNANYNGVDSFQYLVTDTESNESSVQTVTINLVAQDDIPQGTDSVVITNEDSAYTFTVDDFGFSDVDGDTLQTVRIDTLPLAGTLILDGVPVIAPLLISVTDILADDLIFSPAMNAYGSPYGSFTFTVQDSNGTFDDVANTLTVNVTSVNDAPNSADKTITLDEDNSHTLLVSDFTYSDLEGDGFTSVRIDTLPTAGQLTLSGLAVTTNQMVSVVSIAAGELVFTPVANANGVGYSNFTFSVQDSVGALDTSPNTITLDVTPVVDVPVAENDSYEVIVNTPFTSTLANGVLFNDSDGDGDALTVDTTPISNVSNGVLALNADGTFTYTPNLDFNGSDSFIYEIDDGTGNTTQATVSINVDYISNNIIGTTANDNLIGAALSDDDIYSRGVISGAENVQGVGGTTGEAQVGHVGSGNDRLIFDTDSSYVADATSSAGLIRIRDFTVGDVTVDTDADTLALGDFLRAGDSSFDGTAADAVRFFHFVNDKLLYIDRDGGLGDAGSAARDLSDGNIYHGIEGGASLFLEFKGVAFDATPSGETLNTEAQIQHLMNLGFLDFSAIDAPFDPANDTSIVTGTTANDNLVGAVFSDDDIFSGGVSAGGAENVQGVGGTPAEAQSAHVNSGHDRLIFDADDTYVSNASAANITGGLIRIRDFTVGDVAIDSDADTLVLGDFLRAGDASFDGTAADAVRFFHFVNDKLLYVDRDGGLGAAGNAARDLNDVSNYSGIQGGASLFLEFKGSAFDATPYGETLNSEAQIQQLMDLGFLDFG
jgi:hypothetical protein